GQALPAGAYGIVTSGPRSRAALVRTDGNSWPCCQDLLRDPTVLPAELGSCPAWQVTYWQGRPVDSLAAEAAAILAEQFAKSLCGGPCDDRLVPGLTRVSRRGVTREFTHADMRDPQTGQTRTGLPLVDAWIAAVNPHRRARASLIIRADDPTRRQLWSWVDGTTPILPPEDVPVAPLFIPDGQSGTVTGNGQIVYAGANATINVAPGVTWFQPVAWASQTPWALGSTPIIVQAGTTSHATAAAELLEGAGGDLLVVALNGTVWHVAGANTGGGPAATGAQEILGSAGEALSAMRVVTLGTDGLIHLFEPTAANAGLVLGVTRTAAAVGQQVAVVTSGTLDGATGLVAGTPYYAGPAGTLVATRPTTGLLVTIGYEGDNDTFVVQVSDSVELA
ncbi:MAG TPA: hypothetical protein PKL08_14900, partial [Thermoanaerobaculaceae bacterium]|nr:hypothetical protein [Thermoanaerobaculaceae bacterium]